MGDVAGGVELPECLEGDALGVAVEEGEIGAAAVDGGASLNWLASRGSAEPIGRMKELPHTRSCFVCGESNPSGLKLRFKTNGQSVQTRFRPQGEHIGFKGTVHGGLIATVLDEIMVWACAVQTKRFSFCAELSVRFLRPVRPNEEVSAAGYLVANRRGRLFEARAELKDLGGAVLASATGKYVPVKEGDLGAMAADFVGDAGEWLMG
jgi:acyl-coenzyme A thioesterase PaaI-like protein